MQFKYRYTEYFNENFAMFLLFIAITLFVQDVVVLLGPSKSLATLLDNRGNLIKHFPML